MSGQGWRERLRRVGVIGVNEGRRTAGGFSPRTRIVLVILAVAMGLLAPALLDRGMDTDHGLYRVATDGSSPLDEIVRRDASFRLTRYTDPVGALERGEADLALFGESVAYHSIRDARLGRVSMDDARKSNSALQTLEDAVEANTLLRLFDEPDQDAAFPIRVTVTYVDRPAGVGGPSGLGSAEGDPAALRGDPPEPDEPQPGEDGGPPRAPSSGEDGEPIEPAPGAEGGGNPFLPEQSSVNTPSSLTPPFPFRSLLLAYLFLIPMNFILQVYGGSVIGERVKRFGEPLLASPSTPWEIIMGKTWPYMVGILVVSAGITVWIGGGWLTLLSVIPLGVAFLAMIFSAAMFARSFRELTFLSVFISVFLTLYAFLPAVFTSIHPVAFVSPITMAVVDLRDGTMTLAEGLYSTLPLTLMGLTLFYLAAGLFREEDLFHQKRVMSKAVDAFAQRIHRAASGMKLTFLLIPGVFVLELMLLTFLFAWPFGVSTILAITAVAGVEEVFKALPSYAAATRDRVRPDRVLLLGAFSGLGFWLGEKGFLLASLVGLFDVDSSQVIFGNGALAEPELSLVWLALLLAPLLLHLVTASISAWGAKQRRKPVFLWSLAAAIAVHTVYNLVVIRLQGVGL